MEYSKNERAEKIVWLREDSLQIDKNKINIVIDLPIEFWYKCPVCKKLSEWLNWSEYNWFLWCDVCNKDFPTCLCTDNIDSAINIYLDCFNYAKENRKRD